MAKKTNNRQDKVQTRKAEGRHALVSLWIEGQQCRDQEERMGGNQIDHKLARHGWEEWGGNHADLTQEDQERQQRRDGSGLGTSDLGVGVQLSEEEGSADRHATKESEEDEPPCRSPFGFLGWVGGVVGLLFETEGLTFDGPACESSSCEEEELATPPPFREGVCHNRVCLYTFFWGNDKVKEKCDVKIMRQMATINLTQKKHIEQIKHRHTNNAQLPLSTNTASKLTRGQTQG